MRHGFILAGGSGTRLRPYTLVLPKPLIPLGGESIIERVLRSFRGAELSQVTVSLGYLGHLVEAVIGDGSRYGLSVAYTRETEPLGTAGALNLLTNRIDDDDTILVVNGDTLTSLDMGHLLAWFEAEADADAAMVCVEREVKIDYGVVEASDGGDLIALREKPTTHNLLSTGINVFRGSALRQLEAGRVDMPDFLMSIVSRGGRVVCKTVSDLWMDLGRVEDLTAANDLIERGML